MARTQRLMLALALMGACCAAVAAERSAIPQADQAPPPETPKPPTTPKTVEQLKEEILQLTAEARAAAAGLAYPRDTRLGVYAGADAGNAAIVSIAAAVDDQPAVSITLTPAHWASLRPDCLIRMLRVSAAAGTHRIRATYRVRPVGQAPDAALTEVQYDGLFAKAPGPEALQLTLHQGGIFSSLEVQALARKPESAAPGAGWGFQSLMNLIRGDEGGGYQPGSSADPDLRYARFLAGAGNMLDAATVLRLIQTDESAPPQAPALAGELAEALTGYGDLRGAEDAYGQFAAAGAGKAALARLRLRLAEAWYLRGDLLRSGGMLAETPQGLGKAQLTQWQDLQARVLLAQARYAEAREVLLRTPNNADFESYVRYFNLGIALYKSGDVEQSETILDRVGSVPGTTDLMHTLSDKANLALGAHFLHNQEGALAIPVLERVRTLGPYSNRALLDLGWAWLAPQGSTHGKARIGDERTIGPPPESFGGSLPSLNDGNLYQRYRLGPFALARIESDPNARARHALSIWSILLDRDAQDPAVREGMLAIATLLESIGAKAAAERMYTRAIGTLESTDQAIAAVQAYVRDPLWISTLLQIDRRAPGDFSWELGNLPPPRFAPYVQNLLASNQLQYELRNIFDLRMLKRNLDVLRDQPGTAAAEPLPLDASVQTQAVDATDNAEAQASASRSRIDHLEQELIEADQAQTALVQDLV